LYAAVPGIRKSLLGMNAKQFGERFHHLQHRRSHTGSPQSNGSLEDLNIQTIELENDTAVDAATSMSIGESMSPTSPHR
jgi:hypothetical protein